MSKIKQLVSDTVIYGVTSILGRIIFVLLSRLYTNKEVLPIEDVGAQNLIYTFIAFAMVFFGYGLETAFFRFALKDKTSDLNKTLSTALISTLGTTLTLGGIALLFKNQLAQFIAISGYETVLAVGVLIIMLDTLTSIPFAYLRAKNKPIQFASIKLLGIFISVGLNIFFLWYCPKVMASGEENPMHSFISSFYKPELNLFYVFLANAIDAGIKLLLLAPIFRFIQFGFDRELWKKMLTYGSPIMLVLVGSMVNEVGDRTLLNWLLPGDETTVKQQVAIYSSCYKLSIFLALFTQAFRYAGEPFFFSKAKDKDAKQTYALVLKYFTIFTLFGFLVVGLNLNWMKHIIIHSNDYFKGLHIVPILLLAYVFSGMYYNLSVWYKLSDKTFYGAIVALIGALVTIIGNVIFIPKFGYTASAWTTLACFASMTIIAYIWGQKEFPVPYNLKAIFGYFAFTLIIYFASLPIIEQFEEQSIIRYVIQLIPILIFLAGVGFFERKNLKGALKK